MKNEEKSKADHLLSPVEKQVTPLSNEVDPKDVFLKARQSALRHAGQVKMKSKPFRK